MVVAFFAVALVSMKSVRLAHLDALQVRHTLPGHLVQWLCTGWGAREATLLVLVCPFRATSPSQALARLQVALYPVMLDNMQCVCACLVVCLFALCCSNATSRQYVHVRTRTCVHDAASLFLSWCLSQSLS